MQPVHVVELAHATPDESYFFKDAVLVCVSEENSLLSSAQ